MEVVYAATLPKASKPFIYMAITLPPEHVDVNVHPTKREVIFLTFMYKRKSQLVWSEGDADVDVMYKRKCKFDGLKKFR